MVHKMLNFKEFPTCVGIIGSRSFADSAKADMKMYEVVRRFVYQLPSDVEIVSGGAEGIDSYAEDVAYVKKFRRTIYRRQKGLKTREEVLQDIHARNTRIVEHVFNQEGIIVAFMDENSYRGTTSTIKKARKLGVPVIELFFTGKGDFTSMNAPAEYLLNED